MASPHRYWKIFVQATHYGSYPGQYCCLAEVQLLDSGGINRIGSGTAAASSATDSSHLAGAAVDGNASTFWNGPQNGPWWWSYDFGAGNSYDIYTWSLTSRADIGDTSPYDFMLQYSDDGTHWTTTDYNRSILFSAGQTRTFSVTKVSAATASTHRYWRLNITHDAYGPDQYVSIAELGLCQRSDGANVIGAATLSASSSLFAASAAADNDVTSYWSPGATATATLQADFGATPRDISKVTIYSRTDVPATGPSAFSVEYSDNGTTWAATDSFTPAVWSSTILYQEFTVSIPPNYLVASFTAGANRNDITGFLGMSFSITGFSNLQVTQLGRRVATGNTGTHTVYLLNSARTVLGSVSVATSGVTAGTFAYTALGSPVTIGPGVYYLMCSETSAGDFFSDQAPITLTSPATSGMSTWTGGTITGAYNAQTAAECYIGLDMVFTTVQPTALAIAKATQAAVVGPANLQVAKVSQSIVTGPTKLELAKIAQYVVIDTTPPPTNLIVTQVGAETAVLGNPAMYTSQIAFEDWLVPTSANVQASQVVFESWQIVVSAAMLSATGFELWFTVNNPYPVRPKTWDLLLANNVQADETDSRDYTLSYQRNVVQRGRQTPLIRMSGIICFMMT